MEFMDLPTWISSIQHGYDAAYGDLTSRMQQAGWSPPGPELRHESRRHHSHECGHQGGCADSDDECDGCGHHHRDCRCECCIVDADIVVYARCGELRVIPIEVTNDTRRAREDVEVEVSDVRSAGGRVLPWSCALRPAGTLHLEPCSTTKLELGVHIVCDERKPQPQPAKQARTEEPAGDVVTQLMDLRRDLPDVDRCEVGYVTVRLGGCLVRPIVVAIAVQPLECDAYRTGCSCSCCC